jgi:hypothetical protein
MHRGVSNSLSVAIRRFIPPPEHRPRHEIEAEVREEIEFHLAMTAERIAQEKRLDPEQSRSEALKRFGDPESITKECTRIALKERIMLQRINTVLIALVAVGLIVVGIGTWQQQSQTAAAFEQINEKLTGMVSPTPVAQAVSQEPPAARRETVYIRGLVARPGVYEIPQGDSPFTVSRLIAAAGDAVGGELTDENFTFTIVRESDGKLRSIWLDAESIHTAKLMPEDLVQIAKREDDNTLVNGADGSQP